jgi:hypothetical protein
MADDRHALGAGAIVAGRSSRRGRRHAQAGEEVARDELRACDVTVAIHIDVDLGPGAKAKMVERSIGGAEARERLVRHRRSAAHLIKNRRAALVFVRSAHRRLSLPHDVR